MVTFADEYQRSEEERLGSILIRSQQITQEALAKAVETQKETLQRLGHVLTQMGFITQQELRRALQTQVKEAVYRLFRWKEGSYHFSPEPVTYDREMYQPVSAEFLLMEGVRMIDEWPIIEKKITSFDLLFEKVPGREPMKKEKPAGKTGEGEWDDLMSIVDEEGPGGESGEGQSKLSVQERTIYGLVDGERSVQEIIDVGKIGEFESCKVLYGFLSVGLIREVRETPSAYAARGARKRRTFPLFDLTAVAGSLVLVAILLLFNPWSFFALNYNVGQSREEVGALKDDLKIRRLHHALQGFYLEKQDYPPTLGKLVEDRLLDGEDVRDHGGSLFAYRSGEKGYQLHRKQVPGSEEKNR